jgi:hypothetical protein
MTRIPTHTIDDAPEASRSMLESVIGFSPTGRPLNLHAQMSDSPALLAAYTGLRRATAELGTLGPRVGSALMLATAGVAGNLYAVAVTSRLAAGAGWDGDQVNAIRGGSDLDEGRMASLLAIARQAAANSGHVDDDAWGEAVEAGWGSEQIAEVFAYIGLTLFTAFFLNFARTELDVPAGVPA